MNKKIGQGLVLIGMLCILWIGAGREKASEKKEEDYEEAFQLLNKNLLDLEYEGARDMVIPSREEIIQYGLEVKGEFIPTAHEEGIFPYELILKVEQSIYQSLNEHIGKYMFTDGVDENNPYEQLKRELGGEKFALDLDRVYELFPELRSQEQEIEDEFDAYKLITGKEDCYGIFHIPRELGEDYYLIAIKNGGSNGAVTIQLAYRGEDGFETISKFENPNAGFGSVIEYEGEVYYIYLHRNYNMKNFDGFVLHKLGERAKEETLNICYWPKKYVWKNYYRLETNKELEDYIEGIKEEITSDEYLENGSAEDISVYFGKESHDPDFPLTDRWERYRKIDLANIGIPVHMRKSNFIPSNYWNSWHLKTRFFIEDPINENIRELDKMRIEESSFGGLVQMWFEEIGGKVLTFQIYHYTDYSYMLHVLLVEGDKVTQVRTDIFSPERSFIVTEGEIFNGGI